MADPIEAHLDGPRARRAFVLETVMGPPWSIAVRDDAPLTIVVCTAGGGWLVSAAGAVQVGVGDVIVARPGVDYVLADDPQRQPDIRIEGGQHCFGPGGDLSDVWGRGARRWGNANEGPDRFVVAGWSDSSEVGALLLRSLPQLLVRPDPAPAFTAALALELARAELASPAVLDRLLDLVLVGVLRDWATDEEAEVPWSAATDPAVQQALSLMQTRPDHSWSVTELGAEVGLSRSALTRRFRAATGASPIEYLTQWRLSRAADLLADPDLTLEAVGRQVGYSSGFAFSAAFTRRYGCSPSHHRAELFGTTTSPEGARDV
ncbi:AraC family transcriptional regulator [Dermacoccaceae bacterium W4C1]